MRQRSVGLVARASLRWDAVAVALETDGFAVVGPTLDLTTIPASVDAVLVDATDGEGLARAEVCARGWPTAVPVLVTARPLEQATMRRSVVVSVDDPMPTLVGALAGQRHLRRLPEQAHRSADEDVLTARETEVLQLLATGLRNGEVARRLDISPHTVRSHLQRIHSKLGVTTRLAAVTAARRAGLLQRSDQAG